MYTALSFTEPLWLPHIAVFQAKSMPQFLKLISLSRHWDYIQLLVFWAVMVYHTFAVFQVKSIPSLKTMSSLLVLTRSTAGLSYMTSDRQNLRCKTEI